MADAGPSRTSETRTLPAELAGALTELAQAFLTLQHAASFYPEGHQTRLAPLQRFRLALSPLMERRGSLTLGFGADELLWEGGFYGDLPPALRNLVTYFQEQGVAAITWEAGVGDEEIQAFVSRLLARRSAGRREPWSDEEQLPHLLVEGIDYQHLLADEGEVPEQADERRRALWRSLILGFEDPSVVLSPEELAFLREQWRSPGILAELIVEGVGPERALTRLRGLAAALERVPSTDVSVSPGEFARRLGELGRFLPDAFRFRLLESTLEQPGGLFGEAFGGLEQEDLVPLFARNFSSAPEQLERLSRVFQLVLPRQLDRMEVFPVLEDLVRHRGEAGADLSSNVWEEIQELFTGEAGDFMSPTYRELLQRIAARESLRRDAEAALGALPGLAADLEPVRARAESLWIHMEGLRLATDEEAERVALTRVAALGRDALAAGDRERGLQVLDAVAGPLAGAEPPPFPREAAEAALRQMATAPVMSALVAALHELPETRHGPVVTLFRLAPEAAAGPLLDALLAEEDFGRRRLLAARVADLGRGIVPEVLRRLENPQPGGTRALFTLLGELRDETAVPRIVKALRSEDPRIRRDALRALIRIDSTEARRALPALLGDEDDEILQLAAAHLGVVGDQGAKRDLLKTLERRGVAARRAVLALGRMRAAEAVAPLVALLRQRSWFGRRAQDELRDAAAQALWRIGGEEARAAIEQAAREAPPTRAALYRRYLAQWGKA